MTLVFNAYDKTIKFRPSSTGCNCARPRMKIMQTIFSRYWLAIVLVSAAAHAQTVNDAHPMNGVWVVGHRGFKAMAPENTIASFKAAAAVGADYMELYVRPTKDGELILMHDGKVDRTTDGKGPVAGFDVRRSKLDAGKGQKIPTLREALLWAKDKGLRIDIDHKSGPVEDVARVVRETGMTKMVVIEGPRERLLDSRSCCPVWIPCRM